MPDTPNLGGRPSLLNSERQRKITDALGTGSTRKDAAHYAGISYACLRRWVTLGRRCAERHADTIEESGGIVIGDEIAVLDDPDWMYLQLVAAMEEAEAQAIVAAHGTIARKIADGDWNAAAWFLRYVRERKGLDSGTTEDGESEEALRAEGHAIVEELRRRERAKQEAEADQGAA